MAKFFNKRSQSTQKKFKGEKKSDTKKQKKRFSWRRLFFRLILISLILLVLGSAAGYFIFITFTSSHRKWAEELNLEDINNLDHPAIIYDRNGEEIGRIYDENRSYVTLDQVSESMVNALVAQEDKSFWTHDGYDPVGILRAVKATISTGGNVNQGASTITQQLARGSFDLERRTQARGGSRYDRKIVEIFLAMRIEEKYSKRQILEFYLNRIYFGRGFYGIRAASLGYFGKEPADLTIPEAASIAALVKNPETYNPLRNPELNFRWRNDVIDRMYRSGYVSFDEADRLKDIPLVTNPQPIKRNTSFLYSQVYRQVYGLFDPQRADEILKSQGIRIYTTIDKSLQETAEQSLQKQLLSIESRADYVHQRHDSPVEEGSSDRHDYVDGAIYALDNKTGGVLVYVGGRDFERDNFDMLESGKRAAGTAFLPFLFASALDNGYLPNSRLIDDALDNRLAGIGGAEGILGEWGMEVDRGSYLDSITLRQALSWSKIAASARLAIELGTKPFIKSLEEYGITPPQRNAGSTEADPVYYPRVFLGTEAVSLRQLVSAYTVFPNGGTRPIAPYIITKVTDSAGKVLWEEPLAKKARSIASMAPCTSFRIHTMLRESLESGSAVRMLPYLPYHFKGAVKTGTNYDFADNVLIGYSSSISCGVWIGFLNSKKAIYPYAFSSDTCGPILGAIFSRSAEEGWADEPIAMPSDTEAVEICKSSGMLASEFCFESTMEGGKPSYTRNTYVEYFPKGDVSLPVCTVHGDALPSLHDFIGTGAYSSRVLPVIPIMPQLRALQGDDPYGTELLLTPRHQDGAGLDEASRNRRAFLDPNAMNEGKNNAMDAVHDEALIELRPPPSLIIPTRPLSY